jgi:hypothetical protein
MEESLGLLYTYAYDSFGSGDFAPDSTLYLQDIPYLSYMEV